VLAARLRPLDRLWGLGAVYDFHKAVGMSAVALLVSVPFLFAAERGDWGQVTGAGEPWDVVVRNAGTAAAVVLMLTALFRQEMGLRYQWWRRLHNALALVVLASLFAFGLHGLDARPQMEAIWAVLFILGASAYVMHKLVGPARRRRHPFRVAEVAREGRNVWTLRLEPPEGEPPLRYLPGQFQFLTLYRGRGLPVEEHPFTISSAPGGRLHASTIKESGDFTATMGRTRPGDRVAVQGPFGRFSCALYPGERDLVFVAGGIGITPLMSMLRHMRDAEADADVLLLYANRTEGDIVFREELDRMAGGHRPRLRVVHVLSRAEESWRGERGRIGRQTMERHLGGGAGEKSFYVCGPPEMMADITALIYDLGAPHGRVRSESFAL
jgi:predicted ferric reductase